MFHLHNFLLKNDADEAFRFLWSAIALDNNDALVRMGDVQKRWGQPRKAFIYYMKADINGDLTASVRLAECFLNGYGCEKNLNCFWNIVQKAYENGSSDVCLILGNVYRDGKICPRDLKKAREYYAEGVKRGNEACKKALDTLK